MDLSIFQQLGERVDDVYQRANYDQLKLPAIASKALTNTELPDFDFQIVGEFLQHTVVPQEPGLVFSDLSNIHQHWIRPTQRASDISTPNQVESNDSSKP